MTPASFSKALAKTTIRKRNKLNNKLFETAICLGSLLCELNNTEPQANGTATKCKKFIVEGIFNAVKIRANSTVPRPNNVKFKFVIYPFGLDVDSDDVLIY